MPSRPTAYQLKRLVLYPRILYGRFRHRGEAWTQVLDVTNYRKDIYRFIGDRMADASLIHSPGRVGAGLILDVGAFDGAHHNLHYAGDSAVMEVHPSAETPIHVHNIHGDWRPAGQWKIA